MINMEKIEYNFDLNDALIDIGYSLEECAKITEDIVSKYGKNIRVVDLAVAGSNDCFTEKGDIVESEDGLGWKIRIGITAKFNSIIPAFYHFLP